MKMVPPAELERHFPKELLSLLKTAGDLALSYGWNLCLVGGAVRDLFLNRPTRDLDLVLEGNAITLARKLAEVTGGEVRTHPRFGTATFHKGALRLDLATARRESYPRPGALPIVQPGSIEDDLFRRDFSINAMAVHLDTGHFGELLDPYHGRDDLERGLIRVLHARSFCDDPTRILRALRYEQRLGFRLEPGTEELMRRDLTFMSEVTGERLWHELELILSEEFPEKVLSRADELGVLRLLHPALEGNGWVQERFGQARASSPDDRPSSALYLAILAYHLSETQSESLMSRLRIRGRLERVLRHVAKLKQYEPSLAEPKIAPSAIYRLLNVYFPESILAVAIASDLSVVRQRLELYLSKLRYVEPALSGDDLKEMGVPVGRKLGQVLRTLHDARLDGKIRTRGEERKLARSLLSRVECTDK